MSKEGKQWTFWVVVGGVAAAVSYVLCNKKAREKTVSYFRESAHFIDETGRFVKENQDDIRLLVRDTSEKVNNLFHVASSDIEQIAKHSSHLKTTAEDFIDTAKTAATELKHQRELEDVKAIPDNLEHLNDHKKDV